MLKSKTPKHRVHARALELAQAGGHVLPDGSRTMSSWPLPPREFWPDELVEPFELVERLDRERIEMERMVLNYQRNLDTALAEEHQELALARLERRKPAPSRAKVAADGLEEASANSDAAQGAYSLAVERACIALGEHGGAWWDDITERWLADADEYVELLRKATQLRAGIEQMYSIPAWLANLVHGRMFFFHTSIEAPHELGASMASDASRFEALAATERASRVNHGD